ncbi:MAG TPA: hypothetical protein DCG51_10405 [Erysipelotrichaceae bacterium]|nr:hypothetical protein [Erysipelotrichaceae bacterium]
MRDLINKAKEWTAFEGAEQKTDENRLKKLRREELLDILLEIEKENEALAAENASLKQQLEEKTVVLEQAGTLAEASAGMGGLFDAAQKTADSYLENVRRLCERRETRSKKMIEDTKQLCVSYAEKTRELCEAAAEDPSQAALLKKTVSQLFEEESQEETNHE